MSSRRFYLSAPPDGAKAVLAGEEAHHLTHVLRAEPGREVELIDGSGKVWRGIVFRIAEGQVELDEVELISRGESAGARIGLVQSLCKADRLEWVLQKTTELGVEQIHLLEAERSVVRIAADKLESKMERWRKILLAAAKQSRRATVPLLHPPARPASLCDRLPAGLKLILSESARDLSLKHVLRESRWSSAVFCIGPEGGWTAREQECFSGAGFRPVSLGPQILRTETAAIVATAILKYELDDPELP